MPENERIPYFVFEAEMMRQEKHQKRLWIALIVLAICFLLSNVAWLWYLGQYDFESYDVEQDGYGINVVGKDNGVIYGPESTNQKKSSQGQEGEGRSDTVQKTEMNEDEDRPFFESYE